MLLRQLLTGAMVAVLTSSCATHALWKATDPQEYVAVPQSEVTGKRAKLECFKSSMREPSPFLGNGGERLVLEDGTTWTEVSYQYLYLYEYNPSVIVCPGEGKMILGENVFEVVPAR